MVKTIPAVLPKGWNPEKCAEAISRAGVWSRQYQCSRKPWKDGWCKQHHPETEEIRKHKSQIRWKEKRDASPYAQLERALERIRELEAEVLRLENELETYSGN